MAIVYYIERFYNRRRLDQAMGYRSPEEFDQSGAQFTCLLFRGHLSLTPYSTHEMVVDHESFVIGSSSSVHA